MKRLLLLALLLVAFSNPLHLSAQEKIVPKPGEQVVQTLAINDEQTIDYLIFLPEDYDAADKNRQKRWPLMIFLHGAGERGSDIELVKKWGPPKMVATEKSFPFVLVSPQCPLGKRWKIKHLSQLVNHIAEQHQVDKERMYVTGLSMGGYGTWNLVAAHPEKFAAAAPICGGGKVESAGRLTKLPIWAFHGNADKVVPLSSTTEMVDAIKEKGGTNIKLTVYEGVGHNSWSETYANRKLYKWLLSHSRSDSPKK